jgi:hypothetical protein
MFQSEFEGGTEDAGGGIAYYDVQAPKFVAHSLKDLGDKFGIADVGLHGVRFPAYFFYFGADSFGFFVAVVVDDGYVASGFGEFERSRAADAAGSSGYQSDFVREWLIHFLGSESMREISGVAVRGF